MATARAAAAKRKRKQRPKKEQLPLLAPDEASEDQPQNSEPEQPSVPKEEPVKEAAAATTSTRRAKRVKGPKSADEPEFFPEQRNLEDLWKAAFPVGTEWDQLDSVYNHNWNFSNLEDAFEEGGVLHGKKVYLFGCTEPQMVFFEGQGKVICVPAVVSVVSPFPPSYQIGVKSVQREKEEIIPMKEMKMDWVPYIPLEARLSQVDRLKSQIFTLSCTQRRVSLKNLKLERIKKYDYCLPYFYNPLLEDEEECNTVVQIMYPTEPPVVCDFDWDMDDLSEFVDEKVKDEVLSEGEREDFKNFIKDKIREAKKAIKEAKEARRKAVQEMDEEKKEAYRNMRFYKFYPVASMNAPDISQVKKAAESIFFTRFQSRGVKHQKNGVQIASVVEAGKVPSPTSIFSKKAWIKLALV